MRDFDDFDYGSQIDEYGDDYPYDDDENFFGIPSLYASLLGIQSPYAPLLDDDGMPF